MNGHDARMPMKLMYIEYANNLMLPDHREYRQAIQQAGCRERFKEQR